MAQNPFDPLPTAGPVEAPSELPPPGPLQQMDMFTVFLLQVLSGHLLAPVIGFFHGRWLARGGAENQSNLFVLAGSLMWSSVILSAVAELSNRTIQYAPLLQLLSLAGSFLHIVATFAFRSQLRQMLQKKKPRSQSTPNGFFTLVFGLAYLQKYVRLLGEIEPDPASIGTPLFGRPGPIDTSLSPILTGQRASDLAPPPFRPSLQETGDHVYQLSEVPEPPQPTNS